MRPSMEGIKKALMDIGIIYQYLGENLYGCLGEGIYVAVGHETMDERVGEHNFVGKNEEFFLQVGKYAPKNATLNGVEYKVIFIPRDKIPPQLLAQGLH